MDETDPLNHSNLSLILLDYYHEYPLISAADYHAFDEITE